MTGEEESKRKPFHNVVLWHSKNVVSPWTISLLSHSSSKAKNNPQNGSRFFFFFLSLCDEIREFTLAVLCVFKLRLPHGGHAWRGVLWLPRASPWQQLALCSQLAFSRSLISNMMCSGLQRPFGKKSQRGRQTDKWTFRCDSLTSRAFNMMCALLCINDDAVVCRRGL